MAWKSTDSIRFIFEKPGDKLEGFLIGVKETSFGTKAYDLIDKTETKYYFFESFDLKRKLADLTNNFVSITYKGDKTTANNNTMKDFDVKYWDETDGELPDGFDRKVKY